VTKNQLAKKITDALFTGGLGERAHSLVLQMEDGEDIGAWGWSSVYCLIVRAIADPPKPMKPKRRGASHA